MSISLQGKLFQKDLLLKGSLISELLPKSLFYSGITGKRKLRKYFVNLNYIDPKTLNFVSKYFGKSKKAFRCYTRKQLMPQHWDY